MSQIYNVGESLNKKVNRLRKEYEKATAIEVILIPISAFGMPLFVVSCFVQMFWGIILSLVLLSLLVYSFKQMSVAKKLKKEISILSSGTEGEMATQCILYGLPDEYYVFSNVRVIHNNEDAEIDNIVVSPYGMYVIETKNIVGEVSGNITNKEFKRVKFDNWGNSFSENISNPKNQVERQSRILREYIKDVGDIDIPIQKCVFFANNEINLNVSGANIQPAFNITGMFSSKEMLKDFILAAENDESKRILLLPFQEEIAQLLFDLKVNADIPKVSNNNFQ